MREIILQATAELLMLCLQAALPTLVAVGIYLGLTMN